MPFSCSVSNGKLTIRPSPPRFYDIIGERLTRLHKVCQSQSSCREATLHAFRLACDGGNVEWQDVVAIGVPLLGGGARMVRNGLRIQFRGRLRPWPEAPCLKGDWPHRGAPLSARASPFPDVACEAVGTYIKGRSFTLLPRGYGFVTEIGARIAPEPVFDDAADGIEIPVRRVANLPRIAALSEALKRAHADQTESGSKPVAKQADADVEAKTVPPFIPSPPLEPPKRTDEATGDRTATNRTDGDQLPIVAPETKTEQRTAAAGSATNQSWLTLVEIRPTSDRLRPGGHQERFERTMLTIALGLALLAGVVSGVGWLWSSRGRVPFKPADTYDVVLRRDGVNLERPDAQLCGELCRSAQGIVVQIHEAVDRLQGVAPLKRTLMREIRDLETYLAALISAAPDGDQEWRRMRAKLQRVVNDMLRLRDIVDSAERSLSSSTVERGLPRDRAEAFEAIGANPTTSEKILKKLVDALRATWHPDLATDEDDRRARETRIKQINVAWDLISGKRVEA